LKRAPLDRLDDRFHAVYDRTRGETAHSEPVLVVFGDSLFFYRQGRRQEHGMASAQAQLLKAAAHVPVGVYLTMRQLVGRAVLDDGAQRELRRLLRLCLEERDARDSSLGDAIATEMATVPLFVLSPPSWGRVCCVSQRKRPADSSRPCTS
jgi:hypothetical protein